MTRPGLLIFYAIIFLLAVSFQSCEGFKLLTIKNKTTEKIYVKINPDTPRPGDRVDEKFQTPANSKMYFVMPDSSVSFLSHFTGLLFNRKFREGELAIDYMLIATTTDTIVANNKKEIIGFINNLPAIKNNPADKAYIVGDKKNTITIIAK